MLKRASQLLNQATEEKQLAAAVLRVNQKGEPAHISSHGVTRFDVPESVTEETWFDLASLTKILATTALTMHLFEAGKIDLAAPIGQYLHEIKSDLADVALHHFLSHTSGAADWRPFYQKIPVADLQKPAGKRMMRSLHLQEEKQYPAGSRQLYSDVGFALLGFALETITGETLERAVTQQIFHSLNIDELSFLQGDQHEIPSLAATENCAWRGHMLCGEVHDQNTWAAGGCLGQAGLFGTAAGVAAMMEEFRCALAGQGKIFSRKTINAFMGKPKDLPKASFRLGFDSPSRPLSATGKYFSDASFGHLAFTGCSCWCDPTRELTVVLLTNRIHPTVDNEVLKTLRPQVHDAVIEELFTE